MPEGSSTTTALSTATGQPPTECACPVDPRIGRYFDRRSLGRRGANEAYTMSAVSRRLLAALVGLGPAGRTVLELGCGPGALLGELLAAGAVRATGIDLSPEAVAEATQRITEAGFGDRVTLSSGDGARVPLEGHDWVVLDRVICCYPDAGSLVANSIPAARRLYAFSVPASYGWRGLLARLIEGLETVTNALRGRPCPGYVHDVAMIERRLGDAGFLPSFRRTHRLWHLAVFTRPG